MDGASRGLSRVLRAHFQHVEDVAAWVLCTVGRQRLSAGFGGCNSQFAGSEPAAVTQTNIVEKPAQIPASILPPGNLTICKGVPSGVSTWRRAPSYSAT